MPSDWARAKLGTLVEINPSKRDGGWPHSYMEYIDISSVAEGFVSSPPARMPVSEAPSRAQRLVQHGDTVLSTVRPNRRSMFFAKNPSERAVVSTGFAVIRPKPGKIYPRFLYALIYDQHFTDYLVSQEKGAAYPAISPSDIANAEISLPPLAEQARIGDILGSLDDKIELNRRMAATLEEMARAIFKSWFIDFDPVRAKFEGRPTNLPPELDALFPNSLTPDGIPSGWKFGKLGDVCRNHRRSAPKNSILNGDPYVGLDAISKRSLALTKWGKGEQVESQKSRFKTGEILFGKLRPYFHKVCIAPVDGVCSTDILVLDSKEPDWYSFVVMMLSEESTIEFVTALSAGTRMPRTKWSDLDGMPIVVPPPEIARQLNAAIRPHLTRLQRIAFESQSLEAVRDALLPKLISGELSVACLSEEVNNGAN